MEYEAVYRYAGGSCSAPSGGDAIFSRRATATAPGSPSFRIEAVLLGSPSIAVRQATDEAVRSWEDVFAASLPNVDYTRTPINAGCARGAPLVADVVDDVRVFVEVVFIDGVGGTVARAGPCYIRAPSGLPILSTVRLDSADFEAMPHALRVEVIEHELAHALGFASLGWQRANLLRDPSVGGFKSDFGAVAPDTHFVGVDATRAFNSAGGQDYSGAKVPVENAIGGIGNRDSHWRESVLGNELMTTAIGRDVSHPLSAITVGAMRDLGYTVNARAADAYRVPATRSSSFPSFSSALDTPTAKTLAIRSSSATPRATEAQTGSDEGGGVVCGGPFDWAPKVHGTGNLPVGAWNADAIPLTGRAHLSSSSRQGSD